MFVSAIYHPSGRGGNFFLSTLNRTDFNDCKGQITGSIPVIDTD